VTLETTLELLMKVTLLTPMAMRPVANVIKLFFIVTEVGKKSERI
jgi:hypothetical protein